MFYKYKLLILGVFFGAFSLSAQVINPTILSTSGNSVTANNIVLDWTVGEIATSSHQNTSVIITEGFHQTYDEVTSTQQNLGGVREVEVFPNPTDGISRVKINLKLSQEIDMRLYDERGALLMHQTLEGKEISVALDLRDFPAGVYILHFGTVEGQKNIQIIKL